MPWAGAPALPEAGLGPHILLRVIGRCGPDSGLRPARPPSPMFGELKNRPKPPPHEPLLLVLLAALIAGVLTVAYAGVWYVAERLQQGGP